MKTKPYPALCRDCQHQVPEPGSEWNSRCTHPMVNADNSWALANTGGNGAPAHTDARGERERTSWLAPCGRAGKLWELRAQSTRQPTESSAPALLTDTEIDTIWRTVLCDHQQEIVRVTRTGKWFARAVESATMLKYSRAQSTTQPADLSGHA